jgi:hypothetical protein
MSPERGTVLAVLCPPWASRSGRQEQWYEREVHYSWLVVIGVRIIPWSLRVFC